jgi:hypothetical protein
MNNKIASYIKYLVEDCYEEDYDPYYAETWCDNYCFNYSFAEWYFLYRRRYKCTNKYSLTQKKLIIGSDIFRN